LKTRKQGVWGLLTEWAALLGKVAERNLEPHTDSVWAGLGGDATLDIAATGVSGLVEGGTGKSCLELDTDGVVHSDGGIAKVLRD